MLMLTGWGAPAPRANPFWQGRADVVVGSAHSVLGVGRLCELEGLLHVLNAACEHDGYVGPRVQRHRGPRVHGRGMAEQAEGHRGKRVRGLARGGVDGGFEEGARSQHAGLAGAGVRDGWWAGAVLWAVLPRG